MRRTPRAFRAASSSGTSWADRIPYESSTARANRERGEAEERAQEEAAEEATRAREAKERRQAVQHVEAAVDTRCVLTHQRMRHCSDCSAWLLGRARASRCGLSRL